MSPVICQPPAPVALYPRLRLPQKKKIPPPAIKGRIALELFIRSSAANPWMGRIVAARWLVNKERREGKKTSSIVIYLEGEVESDSQTPAKIRLSGKWHHSCLYDWDRTSKVDGKGKERDVEEMDMTA
ncbi:hypothetical protein BDZ91DRAFT_802218 [Kalaharituber pfeilii]|nr:hypothetical protein BDZ91DRAFT_802218 [Kalaharituber pfeilii]